MYTTFDVDEGVFEELTFLVPFELFREKLEEYSHDENGEKAIYPTEQFRRIQTELELKELEKQQELKEYQEKFGKTSIKKKAFGRFL